MDNQVVTPTSFNNIDTSKKSSKKGFIIFAVIAVLVIVVIVFAVVLVVQNKNKDAILDTGNKKEEISYVSNSDYPPMLNLYSNMYDNITIDDLNKLISKSGYDVKKDTDDDDDTIVYLTTSNAVAAPSDENEGGCRYDTNYVKYVVDSEDELTEEQEPNKWATAIEYHECVDGVDTYIMEMTEGKYRNFTGTVTIDYDTKEDAILNQLSVRQKVGE